MAELPHLPVAADIAAAIRRVARLAVRYVARSVVVRLLIFCAALWGVAHYGRPWSLGWLRADEAQDMAESFLVRQGVDLQKYTLIRTVERRPAGQWTAGEGEFRFGVNPAVGYRLRYFRPGTVDGWTVGVAPTGRIYRVQREQFEDEPGKQLNESEAFEQVVGKLATDLGIPSYSLAFISDSLVSRDQRSDWMYVFSWPEALDSTGRMSVTLSGDAITGLSFSLPPGALPVAPARTARSSRVPGFVLILAGVFLIMHYHRTPLALKAAGLWGTAVFLLTLLVRGLTFSQAVILIPVDSPMAGYLARVALSALVEALQSSIMLGLVAATGESLARDVFRSSSSLSRLAPGLGNWSTAWAQAVRWAAPAAAIVILYEAVVTHLAGPVGLCGKAPDFVAKALASPLPELVLPAQVTLDLLWEECVFRLWLLALLLFWLRLPLLALPLAAGAAAFFAGYDFAQFATLGGVFYLVWSLIAGWLMYRVGIIAAMLFHLLVLGGYAGIAMMWTGFGDTAAWAMIGSMMLLIVFVARDRRPLLPSSDDVKPAASGA